MALTEQNVSKEPTDEQRNVKEEFETRQEITEHRRNSQMKFCDVITPLIGKGRKLKLEGFLKCLDQSQRSKKELVSFNSGRTGTKTENRPIGIRQKLRRKGK